MNILTRIGSAAVAPPSLRARGLCAVFGLGLLVTVAPGCQSGGGYSPPPVNADLAAGPESDLAGVDLAGVDLAGADLAQAGGDGGSHGNPDGSTPPADLATGPDLPCAPSVYRCGPGNSVQICNSTGTAWLHATTCAVSCSMGLCTGSCAPKSRRCNVKSVEECNTAGTAWTPVDSCTTSCSAGACALASLDVTSSRRLEGDIYVDGDFIVRSGVTLTAPKDLNVHARSITVESGAVVIAEPTGNPGKGRGSIDGRWSDQSGGGGGYGTAGARGGSSSALNYGGAAFGSDNDLDVEHGGDGAPANDVPGGGGTGGLGGGAIRLYSDTDVTLAGTVVAMGAGGTAYRSANKGGGGGGAGGGILVVAGGKITVSTTLNTVGGIGGKSYYADPGGNGGLGRIKLVAGGTIDTTGATLSGTVTRGVLPPVLITSSSHPEPARVYNDGFDRVEVSWNSPTPSRQGYYAMLNSVEYQVPTPASASFLMSESHSLPASATAEGANYFHVVTVDAMFKPSTVENRFPIRINKQPPTLSSSSHPDTAKFSTNRDAFVAWTLPVGDGDVRGVHYLLDNYGDTVPTKADPFIPLPQKQVVRSMLPDGIWFLHAIAEDTRGYLTRQAAHYRINIGADPGTGVAIGQITDMAGKPVDGATVTVSRGLQTQSTNATGNYNFPMVPAGTYELRASKTGYTPATKSVTITKGGSTNTGLVLGGPTSPLAPL